MVGADDEFRGRVGHVGGVALQPSQRAGLGLPGDAGEQVRGLEAAVTGSIVAVSALLPSNAADNGNPAASAESISAVVFSECREAHPQPHAIRIGACPD